ncbi:TraG/VirB4 family ATPase [Acidithiobacillus ferriphilus]|uniref:VirB4 family type IV secretion/conjugal transfer ATPase n=1 Tax=Acidithiobacillus ferriphilus TaxID=1689834 RepID=UPI001C078331|nr:conjugal transfer protein TrbE [Acidithiobacillus ferriphilus]MBU2833012.1 conjugal transfer protein TrbE [Acidithiobacillus ferriphilus]
MLNIKEFRDKNKAFPDLLNLACIVDSASVLGKPCAIALQKDGSLMAALRFSGPDLESMSHASINRLSAALNAALTRLGDGWATHITAIREPADGYINPAENHFADPISQLIDDERRQQFVQEDAHFLSRYTLVFSWQTPPDTSVAAGQAFVQSRNAPEKKSFEAVIRKFVDMVEGTAGMLANRLKVSPLDDTALLTHIHECITGKPHRVNAPDFPVYLDTVIGHHEFVAGLEPKIDDKHIRVLTFMGYPQSTQPDILEALHNLPFPLRYTTRFIYLDQKSARKHIEAYKQHWLGARYNMRDYLGSALDKGHLPAQNANADASGMADDAQNASAEASSGTLRYGFFTATVILMDSNLSVLTERVRITEAYLNNSGFVAFKESTNAVEAYLGSIPGHTWENVRKPLMHSLNYADLSAKTSVWPGGLKCPSPLMQVGGKKAPALTYAKTTGATPFRFNLHVGDLGHTLIAGPTGAGKSALLSLLAAQWLRYKDARVISFDKGRSMYALTEAVGGQHYDIAGELSDLTFAPLDRVAESSIERTFAENWLESLAVLQGLTITPVERDVIHRAVDGLAGEEGRSITDVQSLLQHSGLKAAIGEYAGTSRTGTLLDARHDSLDLTSRFITFELENLLQSGESAKLVTVPTLMYLFHRIERMLDGRPTLITLDEAWVMLDNPQFLAKIREWLKVLRKKNACVVFATQSLADLKASPLLPVIMESCPTKIFLPNSQAGSQNLRPMYVDFGLEDRQIEMLQTSTPKQDYYVFSDAGHRRVSFDMGPVTLAFTGVSDPRDIKRVAELKGIHGRRWPLEWLKERLPNNIKDGWVDYARTQFDKFGL